MASLTETGVLVELRVRRDEGQPNVYVVAVSFSADGTRIRSLTRDITSQLSAARLQGVTDLLVDVENRVKVLWDIS